MLVIVDGADRTGKSSLCERHQRASGTRLLHFGVPTQLAFEEYYLPLLEYEPGGGEDWWIDRHYLGELVWPRIFGRVGLLSQNDKNLIENMLLQKGAVCVLATRYAPDLEAACANEPCAGRAAEAQEMFRVEVARSTVPWFHYEHGNAADERRILSAGKHEEELAVRSRA